MSDSSVYFTPCWSGKWPDIGVERAGEHIPGIRQHSGPPVTLSP